MWLFQRWNHLPSSLSIKVWCSPQQYESKGNCRVTPLQTYTEVCYFLGLVGHYQRFIKGFACMAQPPSEYLAREGASRRSEWVSLTKEAMRAFEVLKWACMMVPILVFTDYTKPFLLETDASKDTLGAVLSQKQADGQYHPIVYGSRTLTPHKKNYHSTKLDFLALKWAVTEHFKEYLPYQSFVVWMANNLLMYIMSTPNLDVLGHQWVGALAWFNFELEYQKGHDNTMLDVLSWVTTSLDPETVKSIFNGVALGTAHRAKVHDPAMVEGDQCLEQEVHIAAGCPLVEMHDTNWAKAQIKTQCWVQCWIGWRHRSRQIWRYFRQNTPPVKKVTWSYVINRISQFIRGPCTCTQCPRVRLKISCSLWFPRHIVLLSWMGATKMQAIKGMIKLCPCCENISGGKE